MTVLPSDLTAPRGRLKRAYFPADDLTAFNLRLQEYIDAASDRASADGIGSASVDAAVAALATAKGFREIYLDALARPSTLTINDEATRSYSAAQLAAWLAQAQELEATYDAFVSAAADDGATSGYRVLRSLR